MKNARGRGDPGIFKRYAGTVEDSCEGEDYEAGTFRKEDSCEHDVESVEEGGRRSYAPEKMYHKGEAEQVHADLYPDIRQWRADTRGSPVSYGSHEKEIEENEYPRQPDGPKDGGSDSDG